jgi:hypothetical protein
MDGVKHRVYFGNNWEKFDTTRRGKVRILKLSNGVG